MGVLPGLDCAPHNIQLTIAALHNTLKVTKILLLEHLPMSAAKKSNKNNNKDAETESGFGAFAFAEAFAESADLALQQVETTAAAFGQGFDVWLGHAAQATTPFEAEDFKAARDVRDAWLDGVRQLGSLWVESALDHARLGTQAAHQLAQTRSPEAFAEAQKALAIKGVDAALRSTGDLAQATIKVADAVAKPIMSRAGEKFSQAHNTPGNTTTA